MGEFGGGGSIGPPTFFVTDAQKRDYLSRASRALLRGGATKNRKPIEEKPMDRTLDNLLISMVAEWLAYRQ